MLSVRDGAAEEGEAVVFEVVLDGPSGRPDALFYYRTSDVTADAGDDYVAASGKRVVIAPGQTLALVSIDTLEDDVVEGDEHFLLHAYAAASLALGGNTIASGTIRDVTDRRLTVSDAFVVEGGTLAFDVGFEGLPRSRDITVAYSTTSGTATAGEDYTDDYESQRAEVRILAGQTSATIRVPTVDDGLDEDAEELTLALSDPRGAVIVDAGARGVIIDDDPEPALSIDDPAQAEGPGGAPVVFNVQLSEVSGRAVTVDYATEDGTAKEADDYVPAAGDVTIPAGSQSRPVRVGLVDDDVSESVERFRLVLSNARNAGFEDSTGVATIVDDDAPPQVLVSSTGPVREGVGNSAVFEVRLSRPSPAAVAVSYATEDATATAGDDYTPTSGTVTFAADSAAARTVTVPLVNDDVAEDPETFRLVLAVAPDAGAQIGAGTAAALVLDDDNLPTLSVADASPVTEAAGASVSFTVQLSRAAAQAVTVDYATLIDPTAGSAAAIFPQDLEHTSGTLTFAGRASSATVSVPLRDDFFDEHDETFWLRLNNPSGATVLDGTGIGAIVDDDALPRLSLADAGATEGATMSLTARLGAASGRTGHHLVGHPGQTGRHRRGHPRGGLRRRRGHFGVRPRNDRGALRGWRWCRTTSPRSTSRSWCSWAPPSTPRWPTTRRPPR